jgi:hypothetical protein
MFSDHFLRCSARADAEGDPIKVPEKLKKEDVYFITLGKSPRS